MLLVLGLISPFFKLNVADACWPEGVEIPQSSHDGFTFMKGIHIPENDGKVIKPGDTINISLLLNEINEDVMKSHNITTLYYDCMISDLDNLENGEPKLVTVKLFHIWDEKKLSFTPSKGGNYRITWREYQPYYEKDANGEYSVTSSYDPPIVPISVDIKVAADEKEDSAKIISFKAEANSKKITGKLSVEKATVKIKVGSKSYKKATVKNKKFTLKTGKLKKGTKIKVKVTKNGFKSVAKTYKVK